MTVTSDLDALIASTEPMTEDACQRTMRVLSKRAWEATGELTDVVHRLGQANADAERVESETMIASQVEHPDRRADHHKAIAKKAAEADRAQVFALTHMERALHRELEIIDRLLTVCMSLLKFTVEPARGFDRGRAA